MGSGSTSKYGIEYPVATDATNVPGDMSTAMDDIDVLLSPVYQGAFASLPSPGKQGRFYQVASSDTANYGLIFIDTGTEWICLGAVNTNRNSGVGGASLIQPLTPGGNALQGGSGLSADASHKHALPPFGGDADIQALEANSAGGSTGKFADAGHVHPGSQVGDVIWTFASSPSEGWLLANGQAVSYTTYPLLYTLATNLGWPQNNPGTGNFNIIDLRGVSPIGANPTYQVGKFYGSTTASLNTANLPSHSHANTISVTDLGHSHAADPAGVLQFVIGLGPEQQGVVTSPSNSGVTYTQRTVPASANIQASITNASTGSNQSFSILQPVVGMNPMIRGF